MRRLFLGVVSLTVVMSALLPTAPAQAHIGLDHERLNRIFETLNTRRKEAREVVTERTASSQRSPEQRLAACQQERDRINSTIQATHTQVLEYARGLDTVFESVHRFHDDTPSLKSPENKALLLEAEKAYIDAQVQVAVLSLLDRDLNCDNPESLAEILAYRNTYPEAKEALILYRIVALQFIGSLRSTAGL